MYIPKHLDVLCYPFVILFHETDCTVVLILDCFVQLVTWNTSQQNHSTWFSINLFFRKYFNQNMSKQLTGKQYVLSDVGSFFSTKSTFHKNKICCPFIQTKVTQKWSLFLRYKKTQCSNMETAVSQTLVQIKTSKHKCFWSHFKKKADKTSSFR